MVSLEEEKLKTCSQDPEVIYSGFSEFTDTSSSEFFSYFELLDYFYTKFEVKAGHTTGTSYDRGEFLLLQRYIANSDLVSIFFRESIVNFLKTVDNKDQ